MPSSIEAIGRAFGNNVSSIEYTGIPQTYDQLIIFGRARVYGNSTSSTGTNLEGTFRVNGSWVTSYASTMMNAYYTSTSTQSQNNDSTEFIARRMHAQTYYNNNATGGCTAFVMEVFNYRDTNSQSVDQMPMYKYQSFSPPYIQGYNGDNRLGRLAGGGLGSGIGSTIVPVDGFRIAAGSGKLASPSQIDIYGVKYS